MLTFEISKHTQESLLPAKDFPILAAKMFISKLVPLATFNGDTVSFGDKTYKIVASTTPKHPNGYTSIRVKGDSIACLVSSNFSELYMLGKVETNKEQVHISDFKPFGFWNMVPVKRRGL